MIRDMFQRTGLFMRRAVNVLAGPAPSVIDSAQRRQALLTAVMALFIFLFNLAGLLASVGVVGINDPSILALTALTAATFAAYVLARTRWFAAGSWLLTLAMSLTGYMLIWQQVYPLSADIAAALYSTLPLSLGLASAILPVWGLLVMVVANTALISILPAFYTSYSYGAAGADAGNIATLGLLLIIITAVRNATERQRVGEVQVASREAAKLNEALEQARQTLEEGVAERTRELTQRSQELASRSQDLESANAQLERRASQLQALAEVARSIATVESLGELLPQVTRVVSEKFNFYHVGVFLADENREYAVLSAANSAGGQKMLVRGHRLKIGEVGIVGNVVGTGNPRIALDTGADAVYFQNPDLPETRSEMALPLRAGSQIIGALDVQSTVPSAFSTQDVEVLAVLADQVSIAIQNARLFESTQKSLAEAEALYRQFLRSEWARVGQQLDVSGFRYTLLDTRPLKDEAYSEEAELALESGEIQVVEKPNYSALAVPIKLRSEVIGILDIHAPAGHAWHQNELDLLTAASERVAISIENARLFEETTRRAERERTVAEITNKIRSTNDPQAMLRVALDELKRALNASQVEVIPPDRHPGAAEGGTS